MARTARESRRTDEAFDWLNEEGALFSEVCVREGIHWIPTPCFTFDMSVLYDGQCYLGCVLRRRSERDWKAIPYRPDGASRVEFTGDLFEVMSWMEDRANAGRA